VPSLVVVTLGSFLGRTKLDLVGVVLETMRPASVGA
jgi:hypothetical protein